MKNFVVDVFITGSQSESDSLASDEGANDDNTDDELSKVVGGLEFAIDRQDTDSKPEQTKEMVESKPQEEKKHAVQEEEKKPLHSLQSVSVVVCLCDVRVVPDFERWAP